MSNDFRNLKTFRRVEYLAASDAMEDRLMFYHKMAREVKKLAVFENVNKGDTFISEDRKEELDEEYLPIIRWVNDYMVAHGKEALFSDPVDWLTIGKEYDYYFELRTLEQFAREEYDAWKGRNGYRPLDPATIVRMNDPRENREYRELWEMFSREDKAS